MYNVIRDFMQLHLSFYIFLQFRGMYHKILLFYMTFENTLWMGEFKFNHDFVIVLTPKCISFFLSKRGTAAVRGGQIHPDLFTLFFTYMLEKVLRRNTVAAYSITLKRLA